MQFTTILLSLAAATSAFAAPAADPEANPSPVLDAVADPWMESELETRQLGGCLEACRGGADGLLIFCSRLPVRFGPVPVRAACQGAARGVGSNPGQSACRAACNFIQQLPFNQ
ncbi:hypothetical protein CLAFUW4_20073 [Fulvia fulva]|uniref:uncharacterized protein n=1 Tax=Passalora fulva TaxID=5499 RepID=UPI0028524ADD|nr:uncharacterized protein CLAFUR5_20073 [Fulvia fulva]KAK4618165.1 hypothetical protein CLAFUR4_20073 [Fulvia fulva]KAK4619269.1 hypothetical protein CLAFUR0_20073 [Fulvia fulva]WMI38986.1 hypothetical protein CLAFUR5_20073 [Fulvia fulva]WPV18347.1 hypothetical protein CLAFUW4_20073 [Fulvia fulva]WPV33543.1 hypothetical protein CLAFUW7_20073 [Fulvia fulva]